MRHILPLSLVLTLAACTAKDVGLDSVDTGEPRVLTEPDLFEDINDDPNIFEANLSAKEALVQIGDDYVTMLSYGGRVPGPEIRVTQGDRVIIHLQNDLPEEFPTTIHWHGIEGTNAMDGTPVTQGPVMPGESFTYDFIVPRAGVFWFHPHIRGGQTTHSGLYAPLIVEDPDEPALEVAGVLPEPTQTLVFSDVSFYNEEVLSVEVDNAMEIMNGTEGTVMLVNGQEQPRLEIPADGVRLQLLNTSITRFYRLAVPGHTLVRVGGEGGLLETARVEGGSVPSRTEAADGTLIEEGQRSLGYEEGEILLSPAERADVVLVPNGQVGDELTLRWEDYARGRHGMWMEGDEMVMGDADDDGSRLGADLATFVLTEPTGGAFTGIAEGTPILQSLGRSIEPIELGETWVDFTGENKTELQGRMDMWQDDAGVWQMETFFTIDDEAWMPDLSGPEQALAATAKVASLGDTVLWEVHNSTSMAHPWHLHGFSFQPVEFVRHDSEAEHEEGEEEIEEGTVTRWDATHVEFEDTVLIPPATSVFYRVKLEDYNGDGGSAGRWVKHCHIFQHGENGMMSELVVEP